MQILTIWAGVQPGLVQCPAGLQVCPALPTVVQPKNCRKCDRSVNIGCKENIEIYFRHFEEEEIFATCSCDIKLSSRKILFCTAPSL